MISNFSYILNFSLNRENVYKKICLANKLLNDEKMNILLY